MVILSLGLTTIALVDLGYIRGEMVLRWYLCTIEMVYQRISNPLHYRSAIPPSLYINDLAAIEPRRTMQQWPRVVSNRMAVLLMEILQKSSAILDIVATILSVAFSC